MSRGRKWVLWSCAGLAALILVAGLRTIFIPQGRVTISPATTYLTAPLDENGEVDFVRALDGKYSEGVTPDNNVVVALARAVGEEAFLGSVSRQKQAPVMARLGLEFPQDGPVFVDLLDYLIDQLQDYELVMDHEMLDRANAAPWAAEDLPQVADWLAKIGPSLDQVREAVRLPRFYYPIITDAQPPLVFVLTPYSSLADEVNRAMVARAMLRAGSGDVDGAIDDLLAVHRLARAVEQGFPFTSGLKAHHMDGQASQAEQRLCAQGLLSDAQSRRLQDELGQLAPMGELIAPACYRQRLTVLGIVIYCSKAESHVELLRRLHLNFSWEDRVPLPMNVDWNRVCRRINQQFNEADATLAMPPGRTRLAGARAWDRRLRERVPAKGPFVLFGSAQDVSTKFADSLLRAFLARLAVPAEMELRSRAHAQLTRAAVALWRYRLARGEYPPSLEALVGHDPAGFISDASPSQSRPADFADGGDPARRDSAANVESSVGDSVNSAGPAGGRPGGASQPFHDPFSDSTLAYRRTDSGYVLYSVGPNGFADLGLENPPASGTASRGSLDDIVLTVPPPPPPALPALQPALPKAALPPATGAATPPDDSAGDGPVDAGED